MMRYINGRIYFTFILLYEARYDPTSREGVLTEGFLTGCWSVTEQRLSRTIADPEVVQTEMTLGELSRIHCFPHT